ncbi:FecR family protein [Sphingobacterium griseoflavum]|uniref:FecR family protein n=1 Tax=Sphingobacterium griseoflavum TaxID=1474952 RepID=A0ABQ3HVV6_9SPHI|nr:FecR family protein [Sphingobacterium griseoflavum]GHE31436.1 hypothetical protein GCM10017764_13180 [Sphingobacterium griseoflavum]
MPLLPEFEDLLQRFLTDQLRSEEFDSFFNQLAEVDDNDLAAYLAAWGVQQDFHLRPQIKDQAMWEAKLGKLFNELPVDIQEAETRSTLLRTKRIKFLGLSAIAATLILAFSFAFYFWQSETTPTPLPTSASTTYPADNVSQITLPNGEIITIQDSTAGPLYKNNELEIVRVENGELRFVYKNQHLAAQAQQFNSIHTSKGGFTKFQLEDGTKVYLNSESTLRFPLLFAADKRDVFLEGEGYFEVVKKPNAPFHVHTANQHIEVLGTTFNIKSYHNENQETTTLVEGSVKVKGIHLQQPQDVLLLPAQQATIDTKAIQVHQVSPEEYTGWVNKRFVFSGTPLEVVLRDIERWYDIKFEYEGELPNIRIEGNLSKDVALDKLLKVLSINTKYDFSMKGRRVYMEK